LTHFTLFSNDIVITHNHFAYNLFAETYLWNARFESCIWRAKKRQIFKDIAFWRSEPQSSRGLIAPPVANEAQSAASEEQVPTRQSPPPRGSTNQGVVVVRGNSIAHPRPAEDRCPGQAQQRGGGRLRHVGGYEADGI